MLALDTCADLAHLTRRLSVHLALLQDAAESGALRIIIPLCQMHRRHDEAVAPFVYLRPYARCGSRYDADVDVDVDVDGMAGGVLRSLCKSLKIRESQVFPDG